MSATLPYLLLKLRSIDDFDMWLEPTGKVALLAETTLAYSAELAATKPFAHVELNMGGYVRLFALLSIEPVQEPLVALLVTPIEVAEPAKEPGAAATSFSAEFEAGPRLSREFDRLLRFMELQGTTQSLAYAGAARSGN